MKGIVILFMIFGAFGWAFALGLDLAFALRAHTWIKTAALWQGDETDDPLAHGRGHGTPVF